MSQIPKLKIKLPEGNPDEYVYDLEEARNVLNFSEGVFIVEGQWIHSFNEIVSLARSERFREREFIEVEWLHVMGGG